jgi:hypothetical protein
VGVIAKVAGDKLWLQLLIAAVIVFCLPKAGVVSFNYPFFLVGYLFNKYQEPKKLSRGGLARTLPLFILLVYFYRPEIFIYHSGSFIFTANPGWQLYFDLYRILTAALGCASVFFIVQKIKPQLQTKWGLFLQAIGHYSLPIYTLTTLVLSDTINLIVVPMKLNQIWYNLVCFGLTVIYSCILLAISRWLVKTSLGKVLMGER